MASQQNQPSSNTATATTSNNAVAANLNTDIEQFINHIKQISPSAKHNFQDLLKSMIEYVMVAPKHHTATAALQEALHTCNENLQRHPEEDHQLVMGQQVDQLNTLQKHFNNIAKVAKAAREATWTLSSGESTEERKKEFCQRENQAWLKFRSEWQKAQQKILDEAITLCWTIT